MSETGPRLDAMGLIPYDGDEARSERHLTPELMEAATHFECNFGVDRDDAIFKEFNIL